MKRLFLPCLWTVLALSLHGCITPNEKSEMRTDIGDLQNRLTQLERNSKEKGANLESRDEKNKKQIASTQSELERMNVDLQKFRGDLDALKVGVKNGEMPGTPEDEGSIAKTLAALTERMDAMEAKVQELQAAKEKPSKALPAKKEGSKSSGKVSGLKELKEAFEKGKFAIVADAGPEVAKEAKGAEAKEEAQYITAESLYKLGKMRDAALKYNDFVEQFANSGRMPAAKMRLGDCFRRLGDKATAKLYYQELVTKFPQSEQAKKAQERLESLGKEGASNKPKVKTKTATKSSAKTGRG